MFKSIVFAACVVAALFSAPSKAELISTGELLKNPAFAGNSSAGWSASSGIYYYTATIDGKTEPITYSKTASYWLRQTVDLNTSQYNLGLIDAGGLRYDASVFQSSWSGDSDKGRLIVYFLDENKNIISNSTLGYRDPNGVVKSSLSGYIPSATRSVMFSLEGVRSSGTNNDAYFGKGSLNFSAERDTLALHGGYFVKDQIVVAPTPTPTPPNDVSAHAPVMAAGGIFLLLLGGRRKKPHTS